MKRTAKINVEYEIEDEIIKNTKVDCKCSPRELVCAAMALLEEAVLAGFNEADKKGTIFSQWVVDAFNSQAAFVFVDKEEQEIEDNSRNDARGNK